MGMKFEQIKVWPTRRVHLFVKGEQQSFCSLAERAAGVKFGKGVDYPKEENLHPYDDLNFCQCCRRKADRYSQRKYVPLTVKYKELKEKLGK